MRLARVDRIARLTRVAALAMVAAACNAESRSASAHDSASAATTGDTIVLAALRDSLIQFGIEDQAGRDSTAQAVARVDTVFLRRLMETDSVRTRWLQRVIAERGWPGRSRVGDRASNAAWLIVQHSPIAEFQERMVRQLEAEVARGEIRASDLALLSDRVRVHRGEPQRYGSQFSVQGNRLVADPIVDIAAVDSLRAAIGLPPMTDYVREMAKMYRMPVEWPPKAKRH